MVLHVPFVHFSVLDDLRWKLRSKLANGGEHGPAITISIQYGLIGLRSRRGRVPLRVYWFLHAILADWSVELKVIYNVMTVTPQDVADFVD